MGVDSSRNPVTWTLEAQSRLQQVPEGVMRELTRQRVEELARRRDQSIVTVELMGDKYHQWAEGSARATSEMAWTEEARQTVERIPDVVRGMVVRAIEAYAQQCGLTEITPGIMDEAKAFWGNTGRFHRP